MANAYREFLLKNGVLEKLADQGNDIKLYLDLIGAVDTTTTILGVPVATKAKLTTFEDAKIILLNTRAIFMPGKEREIMKRYLHRLVVPP